MRKLIGLYYKLLTVLAVVLAITGCAQPASKEIELSKQEIQQEEQIHQEMAKKYKPKNIKTRKHQDLSVYRARLDRVYPTLLKATQNVCKKGKCSYEFHVADEAVLNAWADGKTVNITPLMMDFLETDKELALILAHELSHNVMGHINKKMQNVIIGMIFDVAAAAGGLDTQGAFSGIGGRTYSQAFENEADYVGIYIMALAGYDVTDVHHIWRKMSLETQQSINGSFFNSHPSNPERFLRMQKAINEVKTKQANKQPLLPDSKK